MNQTTIGTPTVTFSDYIFLNYLNRSPLADTAIYLDKNTQNNVVIKVINPSIIKDASFSKRFSDRAELIANVTHSNITHPLEYGVSQDGRLFLIREHTNGETLRTWMKSTSIDPQSALNILFTLADAVEQYHQNGIAHGAVRPANIWINEANEIKLEGFPLATLLPPSELVAELGLEVINSMPPEFTSGAQASIQGDIYELASVYYELVTGQHPKATDCKIPTHLRIDARISHIISKALSINPHERQQDIAQFREPLYQIANSTAIYENETTPIEVNIKSYTSILRPLIAILLILSIGGAGVWYFHKYQKKQEKLPNIALQENEEETEKKAETTLKRSSIPVPSPTTKINNSQTFTINCKSITPSQNSLTWIFTTTHQDNQLIQEQIIQPNNSNLAQLTHYHFENERGLSLTAPKPLNLSVEPLIFSLKLQRPIPDFNAVRLRLKNLKNNSSISSKLLYRDQFIKRAIIPPQQASIVKKAPLKSTPRPDAQACDAFIYTAHFYLGGKISLLKLQFGNAGVSSYSIQQSSFQCAFSMNDKWDEIIPFDSKQSLRYDKDIAAGGFTGQWLTNQNMRLKKNERFWTKHTFRVHTTPEIMQSAKFLLVKINSLFLHSESNYKNNVIAIPLDFPDQWHTVTQTPSDFTQ